jgi:hypothetical protein
VLEVEKVFEKFKDLILKVRRAYPNIPGGIYYMLRFVEWGLSKDEWADSPHAVETMELLTQDKELHWVLARHVLSKPKWIKHPESADWMARIIAAERADGDLIWHSLSMSDWATHPRGPEFLSAVAKLGHVDGDIDRLLIADTTWQNNAVLKKVCGGIPTLECLKNRSFVEISKEDCNALLVNH